MKTTYIKAFLISFLCYTTFAQQFPFSNKVTLTQFEFCNSGSEFATCSYKDGFVFVSDKSRKENVSLDSADLDLFAYTSDKTVVSLNTLGININTGNFHEGPAIFYNNGNSLIFTKCSNAIIKSKKGRKEAPLFLYSTELNKTTNTWTTPKTLSINDGIYSYSHPAITRDGKTLYFVSNQPGQGKMDILVSTFVDGDWSFPVNFAKINTAGNEMFPVLSGDSILYFSSDGRGGLGGLDIYAYHIKSGIVLEVPAPINSNADDFGLLVKEDGSGIVNSNRSGDDQIFRFEEKKEESATLADAGNSSNKNTVPTLVDTNFPNNGNSNNRNADGILVSNNNSTNGNNGGTTTNMANVNSTSTNGYGTQENSGSNVVASGDATFIEDKEHPHYTIQIYALVNSEHKENKIPNLKNVERIEGADGYYHYVCGHFDSKAKAKKALTKIKSLGFTDAFVREEDCKHHLKYSPEMVKNGRIKH